MRAFVSPVVEPDANRFTARLFGWWPGVGFVECFLVECVLLLVRRSAILKAEGVDYALIMKVAHLEAERVLDCVLRVSITLLSV